MKLLVQLFSVCLVGYTQSAPPILTSTIGMPDGKTALELQNGSNNRITAIIFTARLQRTGETASSEIMKYADNRQGGWPGVARHTVGIIGVSGPGMSAVISFRAGALDDGSTFGDPTWGARITQYRQANTRVVSAAIEKLDGVLAGASSIEELLQHCSTIVANGRSNRVPTHGVDDWIGELSRYTNQNTVGVNSMVVKLLTSESSKADLAALSLLLNEKANRLQPGVN
jgi:hypothetical protein